MTNRAALLQEIETLPANCVGEVIDFVAWIKHRKLSQIPATMIGGLYILIPHMLIKGIV